MRWQITQGRVIDPASGFDQVADVIIDGESICAIGPAPDGFVADKCVDAQGQIVAPGLVDLAARLREPGAKQKGTILSETRAAAAGGVTTLCCPPDTHPVIDTPAVVELIHQRAEQAGFCQVHCLGALTVGLQGEMLSEMAALRQIGCRGVSNGLEPIVNTLILRRALEYASTCGLTVFLHPEDPWFHSPGGVHEGPLSTRLGLPGIPAVSETIALGRYLQLIELTGVRAHFCRLSTARGAAMIAEAQARGLPISADVCAHQLHMTDTDIGDYNPAFHTRPPLRTTADRDGLRAAVKAGTLNAICSDHQPHDIDAKTAPFALTEPGISALETLLPLSLDLVGNGVADLRTILSAITDQPADILGINAGRLQIGAAADICVFDPNRTWRLDADTMLSKGRNTPLLGRELRGRVTHTFLRGQLVYALSKD